MSGRLILTVSVASVLVGCASLSGESTPTVPAAIVCKAGSFGLETLAAREVRRYVYLRTGQLLPIVADAPESGDVIEIGVDDALDDQAYRLKTRSDGERQVLQVDGGSAQAALWGAYHLAEQLGVRFYVHGDVVPDDRVALEFPQLDETHEPLFATRGIQPFHDFTEGPDWWQADDFKAYFAQLAKMRMNFLGLHCYPEGGVGPEPLVWIGHPDDIGDDGKVRFAAPTRWASTAGGAWGYAGVKTSELAAGAGLLFPEDEYGPTVTRGHRPKPTTPEGAVEVFERAGAFLRDVFAYGRALGVKICLGTETPLRIPATVKERLKEKGLDPDAPSTVYTVYEGMFRRIEKTYAIDTYWLWTPEGWTWSGANKQQIDATVRDIGLAHAALDDMGYPFGFATCGWVLGPPGNRTLFDETLPKDVALSCINREVGFSFVEPGFSQVDGRPQWAIPWMEDDPAMVIPQLWVGRMRRDAADAHAYGCDGLIGIHWRTKVLAPNVAALAEAAWSQEGWNDRFGERFRLPPGKSTDVRVGGQIAQNAKLPIAGTEEDVLYQTCRYDVDAYRVKVPNGTYDVTLKLCEVHYTEAGKRVFGIEVEGKKVVDAVDLFAEVGKNAAFDATVEKVAVTDEEIEIRFVRKVELPCIGAIEIVGATAASNQVESQPYARRINCGGEAWNDWEADLPAYGAVPDRPSRPRDLPSADFYADWTRAWFGPEVAEEAAALFAKFDGGEGEYRMAGGAHLPRPSTWIDGPGGIIVNATPWEDEKKRYEFVDALAKLRPRVRGAGNLARFDYWLGTFRYLREVGYISCLRGKLDAIVKRIDAEKDVEKKKALATTEALPVRIELASAWERMMTAQLVVTDTPGELGTIANLEQHVRRNPRRGGALHFLSCHDAKLAAAIGAELPATIHPRTDYQGEPRLIVPTKRTHVADGEALTIPVIVLDEKRPKNAVLHWRPMGEGAFQRVDLEHVGRAVYSVTLPPASGTALEYWIEVTTTEGDTLRWPPTAPEIAQTVVVASCEWPRGGRGS